jgi:mannose/fructose/N-acetylgalactosamine-specific phosphotransferase system component IIC
LTQTFLELKHPETGPSESIRRAGLRNNKETSAGRRVATDKTFVATLLLAAVKFFENSTPEIGLDCLYIAGELVPCL